MLLNCLKNYEFRLYIYQVILQLVCKIISFNDFIWGFISLRNEHGVMRPLAADVLGISKTPWSTKIACDSGTVNNGVDTSR